MLTTEQQDFLKHVIALAKKHAAQYGLDWRMMASAAKSLPSAEASA